MIISYIQSNEKELPSIFYRLSACENTSTIKSKITLYLLAKLKLDEIKPLIEGEESIRKINLFFSSVSSFDLTLAKKIVKIIGEDTLTKKLLNDYDTKNQRMLIATLSKIDTEISEKIRGKIPFIAVVIPVLNDERIVPLILENLADYVDSLLVVDGGSRDNTVKFARSRSRSYY